MRVEVGPRDVASGSCVVSRRDRPGKDGKAFGVSAEPAAFVQHVSELLDDVQVNQGHLVPCARGVLTAAISCMMCSRIWREGHATAGPTQRGTAAELSCTLADS